MKDFCVCGHAFEHHQSSPTKACLATVNVKGYFTKLCPCQSFVPAQETVQQGEEVKTKDILLDLLMNCHEDEREQLKLRMIRDAQAPRFKALKESHPEIYADFMKARTGPHEVLLRNRRKRVEVLTRLIETEKPAQVGTGKAKELESRITNYLSNGGLFNPEMMGHDKVRDLLMDCRDYISKTQALVEQEKEEYLRYESERIQARQAEVERLESNAKYWVEQHRIEAEKRGEAEHDVDLSRDDKAAAFELLERERDQLKADINTLKEKIEYWAKDSGDGAEDKYGPCPQGGPIDFWRGHRNALNEVLAFIPKT